MHRDPNVIETCSANMMRMAIVVVTVVVQELKRISWLWKRTRPGHRIVSHGGALLMLIHLKMGRPWRILLRLGPLTACEIGSRLVLLLTKPIEQILAMQLAMMRVWVTCAWTMSLPLSPVAGSLALNGFLALFLDLSLLHLLRECLSVRLLSASLLFLLPSSDRIYDAATIASVLLLIHGGSDFRSKMPSRQHLRLVSRYS